MHAWLRGTDGTTTVIHSPLARTTVLKEPYIASSNGTFAVSEITPQPAVDDAHFYIESSEAGNMNVVIYNYAGSVVSQGVTNMFIDGNTETRVPLDLNKLASGVYSVEVTLNGDKVVRTIVIRK